MNLSGKVFVVTGALGVLGQALTACLTAHGAKLALVGKRAGPRHEHRAGALLYGHRKAHFRTSFLQWNCESPWLALNRCIAREEWARPTHSWMAQQR